MYLSFFEFGALSVYQCIGLQTRKAFAFTAATRDDRFPFTSQYARPQIQDTDGWSSL